MKKIDLGAMDVEQLVKRFTTLALEQDDAALRSNIKEVNRLFDELKAVEDELRHREGDQRHALSELYRHPNPHVQLKAVKATLAVMPELARQALQRIADSNVLPQAGEAGMSLLSLERGWFKPR